MALNRKTAQDHILRVISRMSGHKENAQMYAKKFAAMSDEAFHQFMQDLKHDRVKLSIVEPNFTDRTDVPNAEIIKMLKEQGYDPMQRLWVDGKDDFPSYLTPVKYPVFLLPIRRASQALIKKISVPPHTRVRDLLTGQVTGESKGATISGPENQLLGGMGADMAAIEMMKYRGGDARGEAALVAMLSKTGRANQQVLENFASGVTVNASLRTFLTAAMHRVTL